MRMRNILSEEGELNGVTRSCTANVGMINCSRFVFASCVSSNLSILHSSASWHNSCCEDNLVDPASSHMLASKTKPCMSKYNLVYGETANGSLKQL